MAVEKIKVFLADLLYLRDKSPVDLTTPLNLGFLAAYAEQLFPNTFDFHLYRDPERLLADFKASPCGLLGMSFYIWNEDLTRTLLGHLKKKNKDLVVVAGGPLLGTTPDDLKIFLAKNPDVDFAVQGFGEAGFAALLGRLLEVGLSRNALKQRPITGVTTCHSGRYGEGPFLSQEMSQVALKDIPSPYLSGHLDPFLASGSCPMIQGVRGCPFKCAYCFASELEFRPFPIERVLEEIRYIYQRTQSPFLIVTDDNFGLLERDIEIARFLRDLYNQRKIPSHIYFYYSKKPTAIVKTIAETLKELTPVSLSQQSRNPTVLDAVRRKNLEDADIQTMVDYCKKNKVPVTTELIFGLPGETRESFLQTVRDVFPFNFDQVQLYNLKVFNGVEMGRAAYREKYGLKTRHRLYEGNFGLFQLEEGAPPVCCCETEEIAVETNTYSFTDFLDMRKLGFWIELTLTKKIYFEVLKHLENFGFSPFDFFAWFLSGKIPLSSEVEGFFKILEKEYAGELFPSWEVLKENVKAKLAENPEFRTRKINLFHIFQLLFTTHFSAFDAWMRETVSLLGKQLLPLERQSAFEAPLDELFAFHRSRLVELGSFQEPVRRSFQFDFQRWEAEGFCQPLSTYAAEAGGSFSYEFSPAIPRQFEIFVQKITPDRRPFVWHNFIYSTNLKAVCKPVSS